MNNLHRFLAFLCMMVLLPFLTWAQDHDYSQDYLTFDVISSGTILWKQVGSVAKTISYSKDNGTTWTEITATSPANAINVTAGDKVLLKGTNDSYASDRSNYSGFDGGTATYNIQGNIMSLIYGDEFVGKTTMTGSYNFCSIFKQSTAVSAENLILPATTLTNYCYRAMFSKAHDMAVAPALPATTLAQGCYWYMFEECPISTAPELNAETLVKECYGNMFTGCTSLNYIKCLATDKSATDCLKSWVNNVASTGTFEKKANASWSTGVNAIPSGWDVVEEGTPRIPTILCGGIDIELDCATTGADIYYKLNHGDTYSLYSEPITITSDTFIECYSEKNGKTSAKISQTCEFDNRTIYEYSNQSLDTWNYGGNTITTPYSVNAIDGHSSSYAKGTFNFETDVNLRSAQPVYLWFQHADQSASIYVDNHLVEKHWGGYNAFFVDISNYVHKGTNHIKVALKNNEGNVLAPYAGDFNFNATLGNVKLFTSPYLPSKSYGYDGFHITSTVSSASATINVKTTIPDGATVVCTISGDHCNYSATQTSDGTEMTFSTTITNPHLWNGTIDPYLYNVKLEIYHDNELYHRYERHYGLRYFSYVFNETVNGNSYTGFLLNGQPYLLRGVCVHDDLANKANALNDADYTQEFNIITDLGCNFLRLAHYPHPKEVYDKCDSLGIVVQTEAPWVNKSKTTETADYWAHLEGQCADMVNQHYNHPCIIFWGVGNEINTDYTKTTEGQNFVKGKIEHYRDTIRSLMPNALVGYTVSHGTQDGLGIFNNPTVDWIGQNIYVGWYIDKTSNNPTGRLTTAINNATTQNTPCAYSEYGCGGTQHCHSDNFKTTTITGNNPRHDIEYQMWLHEGHIAAIKNKPELIFTSQWQLFDIAVTSRQEGYKVCLDGETVTDDDNLKYLNNKGLVERDHVTKKDTYYLYKAWWNPTDKFVHICGKDYEKLTDRVIKCYTNDGNTLTLFVNNEKIETVAVENNIATFTATDFNPGDIINVIGATSDDTFTFANYNVFQTDGNWNVAANWSSNAVPADGSNVEIAANLTIPANYVAHAGGITISTGSLTIADGGQLICSNSVAATVQKTTAASSEETKDPAVNNWYAFSSPVNNVAISSFVPTAPNKWNVYRYNEKEHSWEEYRDSGNEFANLDNGRGYLYRSTEENIAFTGNTNVTTAEYTLSYDCDLANMRGFNLIGNPFTHNIYKGDNTAITNDYLEDGFYVLLENGGWDPKEDNTDAIAPTHGILVQAKSGTDGETLEITKTTNKGPAAAKSGNDQIMFSVKNSEYYDNAYVLFKKGHGLNKIEHRNNEIPMLYVTKEDENFAIADIEYNTNAIELGFEAKTIGLYTLSLKAEGKYSYMHLYDKLTGNDVDMLFEDSYSFIGAPSDRKDRFVLRLNYNAGSSTGSETEVFAYQSGNEIIVSREGELQILDVMGRVIISRNVSIFEHIPTSGMTSGTYILRLINDDKVMIQKIVIR